MGGGTGTGAAPIVAEIARDMGILTIGIVTKPFAFEGKVRMAQADEGIANLKEHVDSLVVIPNERLKLVSEQRITLLNAFAVADDVLRQGVQSISDLIKLPGLVNLDFADVTSVMKDAGYAHMGVGHASGKDKAETAASMAISSPLLETSIAGAKGVIINITSSPDIGLDEIETASSMISEQAHKDANIIWGAAFDENMDDEMTVTVVATGFATHDGSDPDADLDIDIPPMAASSARRQQQSTASAAPRSTGRAVDKAPSSSEEDDDYVDIMSIFNRK
jgi:cell division protein FtsZ